MIILPMQIGTVHYNFHCVLLGNNAEEIPVQVIIFEEWSEHVNDCETCNCAPQLAEGGSSNERWKTRVDVHYRLWVIKSDKILHCIRIKTSLFSPIVLAIIEVTDC